MSNKNYKGDKQMNKIAYKEQYETNKKIFFNEWLGTSLEFGDLELSKFLLENGADVSVKDDEGCDGLMNALFSRNIEVVKFALKYCKNVNSKDFYGWTSLMWAVFKGYFEFVKLLIEHGADVNAKNNTGVTPLYFAIYNKNLEITKFLIENGANVDDEIIKYAELTYDKFVEYGTPIDLLKNKKQFIDYLKSLK